MVQLEVDFKSRVHFMDIADVSHESGLAPSTLRYYEKLDLFNPLAEKDLDANMPLRSLIN
ncbi:MerR family DNA-binding transcriptional regulator [Shewanella scandinavica]|uniref:MerR family DNA-binding transcriptional regulator n=1 Tax=Shewanella scandinavica TaxID=3063538 RepID=UPI003189B197